MRENGLTVFLVEQNAFHALKLAHRGYVMVNGQITLSGKGRELLERPEIRAAYLEGGRIEEARAFRSRKYCMRKALSAYSCWSPSFWAAGRRLLAGRAIATNLAAFLACCRIQSRPGGAVRFMHFACSAAFAVIALLSRRCAVLHGVRLFRFRIARKSQMVTQYRWLNERGRADALAPQDRPDVNIRARGNRERGFSWKGNDK